MTVLVETGISFYPTQERVPTHVERKSQAERFHPVIKRFQELIENNEVLFEGFRSMFAQMPDEYRSDPTGGPQVRDYKSMLARLDHIIRHAPTYNRTDFTGCPIYIMFAWPMATPAGLAIFLDPRVNEHLRAVFDVWSTFLASPASRSVLTSSADGWFGPEAREDMPNFTETFVCDPNDEYYGFSSWDDFFTRALRPGVRPVASPDDDSVITAGCEHTTYRIVHNAGYEESFWLKGQPYSLRDMLASDSLAPQFVGGTVYQGFLTARNYHRWHAPVAGTIEKIVIVPGTYYAQAPEMTIRTSERPVLLAPAGSQAYLTAASARALIFIRACNPRIGLMCFMAVGMAEVSTCTPSVSVGDVVAKGDQLGMFHYGGSTHCILFRREAGVIFDEDVCGVGKNVRLNMAIGRSIEF